MNAIRYVYWKITGFIKTFIFPSVLLGLTVLKFMHEYMKAIFNNFREQRLAVECPSFIFGSYGPTVRKKQPLADVYADLHAKYKKAKHVSFFCFWKKQILIRDLDIIKSVLENPLPYSGTYNTKGLINECHFNLQGDIWKFLRPKLSSMFSLEKVREKHSIIRNCSETMKQFLEMKVSEKRLLFEWHEIFLSYGIGVILGTEFGVSCDILFSKDPTMLNLFRKIRDPGVIRYLTLPWTDGQFGKFFKLIPNAVSSLFDEVLNAAYMWESLSGIRAKECLEMLVDLMYDGDRGCPVQLTERSMTNHALVFIEAGSQAIASTMVFCLYELAMNSDIQEHLYEELHKSSNRPLTYERVKACEYLDMVVSETLRKYPPIGFLQRNSPHRHAISDDGCYIEKGNQMFISIKGLQNDPDLFENPEEFDPERFSNTRKGNIKDFSFMPFGSGLSKCPGEHFALLAVKTGLAEVLRRYRVLPPPPNKHPQGMTPDAFIPMFDGGLNLPVVVRKRHSKSKRQ